MTVKLCKYGCGTTLEGFDEEARKFLEAGSGGLHTKERCQEAKANRTKNAGDFDKDDHGNESYSPTIQRQLATASDSNNYVDHTAKPKIKLKILTDPTPEGLAQLYNSFDKGEIRFSQYQPQGALYTVAIYYEEVAIK